MSSEQYIHGLEVTSLNDGTRPIQTVRSSVICVIGTAPEADPTVFPINAPVAMFGRDAAMLAKLGAKGTLPWSMDGIHDQFGATAILIRVEKAVSPKMSVLMSLQRETIKVLAENIERASDSDIDGLLKTDVNSIDKVFQGDEDFIKNIDWQRNGDSIEWLRDAMVETVNRRSSTVDPLDEQSTILAIIKVTQGNITYIEGTDYQQHVGTGGVEWLVGGAYPAERSNYLVEYEHGHRPAPSSTYEVDYNYYDNAHVEGEDVTRLAATDYDPLANYDVISMQEVIQGAKTFVADTDYDLHTDKNRVHWITNSIVESVLRGTGVTVDLLANAAIVLDATEVFQGPTIYTKGVDWSLNANGEIEWLTANKPDDATNYDVNYTYGDRPADETVYEVTYTHQVGELVATSNVVGGVNIDTGLYEGIHAAKAAESEASLSPRIIIAPGFTQLHPVASELTGICETLRAIAIIDGPNTTDIGAINYREQFGSKRFYIIDPWSKFYNRNIENTDQQPTSARVAGLIAKVDTEQGFWHSPSNKEINGITGLSRPVEFSPDDPNSRSNYLNGHEVNTIINNGNGYRLWGGRTCSADSRWAFLTSVRVADMIAESLQLALLTAVDKNITKGFFQEVTNSVNDYMRRLQARNAIILGAQDPCWVDPNLNLPTDIIMGKTTFNVDYSPVYQAEHITIQMIVNDGYLTTIFESADFTR